MESAGVDAEGSKKQHVAFPGGRMEPGDEGEMYTGELVSSCKRGVRLNLQQQCGRLGRSLALTLLNAIG